MSWSLFFFANYFTSTFHTGSFEPSSAKTPPPDLSESSQEYYVSGSAAADRGVVRVTLYGVTQQPEFSELPGPAPSEPVSHHHHHQCQTLAMPP